MVVHQSLSKNIGRTLGASLAVLTGCLTFGFACSLTNFSPEECQSNSDCVEFGVGSVCQSDGFCRQVPQFEPWTFVSIPDFLNLDVADISALNTNVNSTDPNIEQIISLVFDQIQTENPDFVLVAGDLVNGSWLEDADGEQVFGPVASQPQNTIESAADVYYSAWIDRFTTRSLTVYPALGDREIGNNPWPSGATKSTLVPAMKQAWAESFTLIDGVPRFDSRPVDSEVENTAYAVLHKNVLLFTIDPFQYDFLNETVNLQLSPEQQMWLANELEASTQVPDVQHIIVQSHIPLAGPNRSQCGFDGMLNEASSNDLLALLNTNNVDLYLAGGTHHMTSQRKNGLEQIVHGSALGCSTQLNYLVGRVFPNRLELELKAISINYNPTDLNVMWQTGADRPRTGLSLDTTTGFRSVGRLVIDKSGEIPNVLERTGFFLPHDPTIPNNSTIVHFPLDEQNGENTLINNATTGFVYDTALQAPGPRSSTPGVIGNALIVANQERVVIDDLNVTGSAPRTLSMWVRTPDIGNQIMSIFTMGQVPGDGAKWDIDLNGTNGGVLEVSVGNGRSNGTGTALDDDVWHHVAVTFPPDSLNLGDTLLYVDGNVQLASFTNNVAINTGNGPAIIGHGQDSDGFQQFRGSIDDFAFWGRSLTSSEISALYSFAQSAGLNYNAEQAEQVFIGFHEQRDVTVAGQTWRYVSEGVLTPLGSVAQNGPGFSLRLSPSNAGMITP